MMMPMSIDTHDDKENQVPVDNIALSSSSFKKRSSLGERGWEFSFSPLTDAERIERNNLVNQIKDCELNRAHPSLWLKLLDFDEKKISEPPSHHEIEALIRLFKLATNSIPKEYQNDEAAPIWLGYVRVQIRNGEYEEAKQTLKWLKVKKIGLRNAQFYLSWAHIELNCGNSEKAKEIIRRGVEMGILTREDQTSWKVQQKVPTSKTYLQASFQNNLHNTVGTPVNSQSLTPLTPSPLITPFPHNVPTPNTAFIPHIPKLPPPTSTNTSTNPNQHQQQTFPNAPPPSSSSSSSLVRSASLSVESNLPFMSNTNPTNANTRRASLSGTLLPPPSNLASTLAPILNSDVQSININTANETATTAQSSVNANSINMNSSNLNNSNSPSKSNDTSMQEQNALKKPRRRPLMAFMAQRSGPIRVRREDGRDAREDDDASSMQIDQGNNMLAENKSHAEESIERETSIQSMDSTLNAVTSSSSESSEIHTDFHSQSSSQDTNNSMLNTTPESQFFSHFASQSQPNSSAQISSKPHSPQLIINPIIQQRQPAITTQSQLPQSNQVQNQLLLLQQQQRQLVKNENGNNGNNNGLSAHPTFMFPSQQLTPPSSASTSPQAQSPHLTPISASTSFHTGSSSGTLTSYSSSSSSSNSIEQRPVSVSPPSMPKNSQSFPQNANINPNTNFNPNLNTNLNTNINTSLNANFNPTFNTNVSEAPKENAILIRHNSSTVVMSGPPAIVPPSQPPVPTPAPLPNFAPASATDTASEEHVKRSFSHLKEWCGNEVVVVTKKPYIKLDCIGKGGSSKVYKVISQDLQIYALKRVMLKGADPQSIASFKNEIELLKNLRSPHQARYIIQLKAYEINLETGVIHLVLEFGEVDLARLISQHSIDGVVQENFIRVYWQQMLEAVSVIHEERIVHGDLKPANFVSVQGNIKLIDFGIAKAIQNDTTNIARESATGTLNYMSPETITGTNVDGSKETIHKQGRASDVWSLGCILYQMAYGKPPFANLAMVRRMHAIADPNHVIEFKPHRNAHLVDTLKRCLQYTPSLRPTIPELVRHPFLVSPS
eukprot:TRINITY_DN3519_c0_g1_i1.p1 TRINITY_DN3519_c0_g1~~TRINITY_DN3519_c0_g1_i1.p1  ORF type:complete len:1061 (-),score=259.69 TRINITY_DN3519_c0_g1_i1:149-3331(-)